MPFDTTNLLGRKQSAGSVVLARGWSPGGLGEVIARVPKTEVTSAKLSPGVLRTNLTITFNGEGRWEFEQSPLIRPVLVKIIRALGY